ncbi:hypothetical protein ABEB36_004168 [Hypothenemus hampei]|uniref:Uncharacterized protein n=1 Tax=Hypothenemus hampei TaxID=57062 RepID=A0ABD1F2G1_HYPHA
MYLQSFSHSVWTFNFLGYNVNVNSLLANPYCKYTECCNDDWIKFRRNRLMRNLTNHVYGQPLLQHAVDALTSHFNPNFQNHKALVLSFHGMTGTGKNYVSNFIADSLYINGVKSKYVHHFIGRLHFPDESKIPQYKEYLYNNLKAAIKDCPRQLFIFDEVDKTPPEVLNSIKPMVDYRDDVDGVNYSEAVFIFLSNIGADVIREHFHDLYFEKGRQREDLQMIDFEFLIQKGAFNEKGGLFHGDIIANSLIDHYIPFLPLQEEHVKKCILNEFQIRNVNLPKPEHVEHVLKFVEWGPDESLLFAKTGCKRLSSKVALLVDKYYRHESRIHNEL